MCTYLIHTHTHTTHQGKSLSMSVLLFLVWGINENKFMKHRKFTDCTHYTFAFLRTSNKHYQVCV